jgi:hypothetical protein
VQHAATTKAVAADHRIRPRLSARSRNAFSIERLCNRTRWLSGDECFKDAPYDLSLRILDPASSPNEFASVIKFPDDPIAILEAATRPALANAPF